MSDTNTNISSGLTQFVRELTAKYDERYSSCKPADWEENGPNHEVISPIVARVAANEDAIEVLNGEGDGSVKKALADAKAYTDDEIDGLDAEVTSSDRAIVTVKVTEVDGVVTTVNVTDSNIGNSSVSEFCNTVYNMIEWSQSEE